MKLNSGNRCIMKEVRLGDLRDKLHRCACGLCEPMTPDVKLPARKRMVLMCILDIFFEAFDL